MTRENINIGEKKEKLWPKSQNMDSVEDLDGEYLTGEHLSRKHMDGEGQIRIKRISFAYSPHRPIVDDLKFNVGQKEELCIQGDNSSGKTSLLQLILLVPMLCLGMS